MGAAAWDAAGLRPRRGKGGKTRDRGRPEPRANGRAPPVNERPNGLTGGDGYWGRD